MSLGILSSDVPLEEKFFQPNNWAGSLSKERRLGCSKFRLGPTDACANNKLLLDRNHQAASRIAMRLEGPAYEAYDFVFRNAFASRFHGPCLLIGHAGVGKTSLISLLCDHIGVPMIRVRCPELAEVEAQDFFYGGSAGSSAHIWKKCKILSYYNGKDGLLVQAAKAGQVVFLDNLNRLGRGADALKSFLDGFGFVDANGRQIWPKEVHANFRLIAAMRPACSLYPDLQALPIGVMSCFHKFCWPKQHP